MGIGWKFTWEAEVNGLTYPKYTCKRLEGLLNLRPFIFRVIEVSSGKTFTFPVSLTQRPRFFRKVYGQCTLSGKSNQIIRVINCFGVESADTSNLVWEWEGNYYFVDNVDKHMRLL